MDAAPAINTNRRKRPNPLNQWLVYFTLRVAVCFAQTLSIETCQCLARLLAFVCYDVLRLRRKVIDGNLKAAYGQLSEGERARLARQMWQHIVLMAFELALVRRKVHDTNWRNYVTLSRDDIRTFVKLLLDDRPVVVVSGHFGNFEVGGIIAGLLGFPTFTVARPFDNPLLHRYITRFRETTGQFMLSKRGSARQIDALLQAGSTLVLLGDQAAGPKGCWVEFFGRPASCHKAVALFSLVNRAPMVLAYSKRLEQPLQFRMGITAIHDPLTDEVESVKELTQWYSDELEKTIRTAPDQYWWLHRRWKKPPRKRARRRRRRPRSPNGPPAPHGQSVKQDVQDRRRTPRAKPPRPE